MRRPPAAGLSRAGSPRDGPPTAVLIVDADRRVRHLDGSALNCPGIVTGPWTGQPLAEVLPAAARTAFLERYEAAAAGAPQWFDYRTPEGTRDYRVQMAPLRDGGDAVVRVVVVIQDATEERAAQRERMAAEQVFRQAFDASPIGMLLTDAEAGRCLRANDALCRMLQRSRSELVGRPFRLVADVDMIHRAKARMMAGDLESLRVEQEFQRADGSRGWCLLHMTPVHSGDGAVRAFHSQLVDITEQRERERHLEQGQSDAAWLGRIRAALDGDDLLLYEQPIVDLATGETVQRELLLRMRDDDGSIVAPGEFLPVAERYGLIAEIDRWVIRRSVALAAQGTPVEFNVSGRSIGDPAIVRELADALQATGADPSLLVIEITETTLAAHTEAGRRFAENVRALGCGVALDDFGTGFSSLRYLKRFPADHLKIDVEFVRELAHSETDMRVVRGIVGLAREFDLTTVAEGVEDEATLLILRDLGVDLAQGFLFGRPAPGVGPADRAAVAVGARGTGA